MCAIREIQFRLSETKFDKGCWQSLWCRSRSEFFFDNILRVFFKHRFLMRIAGSGCSDFSVLKLLSKLDWWPFSDDCHLQHAFHLSGQKGQFWISNEWFSLFLAWICGKGCDAENTFPRKLRKVIQATEQQTQLSFSLTLLTLISNCLFDAAWRRICLATKILVTFRHHTQWHELCSSSDFSRVQFRFKSAIVS